MQRILAATLFLGLLAGCDAVGPEAASATSSAAVAPAGPNGPTRVVRGILDDRLATSVVVDGRRYETTLATRFINTEGVEVKPYFIVEGSLVDVEVSNPGRQPVVLSVTQVKF